MALSDDLHKLADRAEEAEKHAAAAKDKATAQIQQDRDNSREVARQQAEQLREAADSGQGKISAWWNDVQRDWNRHVAKVQESIEKRGFACTSCPADTGKDLPAFGPRSKRLWKEMASVKNLRGRQTQGHTVVCQTLEQKLVSF